MKFPEYQPMRSLIYVHCPREEYRHRLINWLYNVHIPDSISQFEPYVTKYSFYSALPVPPEGERFGTYNHQLTEHYWMINSHTEMQKNKALTEVFPKEALIYQGILPDKEEGQEENVEGDDARSIRILGCTPFIYAYIPIWWEEDLKGSGRTIADGPNYRWQFMIKYPEGVSIEEGEEWLYGSVFPYLEASPLVNRIMTSRVLQDVNGCPYYRVIELWFDGPEEWYRVMVNDAAEIPAPEWIKSCAQKKFPYMEPFYEIAGIFVPDHPTSDNFSQYRGYLAMR